jgi:hypothetical protein
MSSLSCLILLTSVATLNMRSGSSNVHVSYCVAGSVRKTKNLVLQEVLIFSLCPI